MNSLVKRIEIERHRHTEKRKELCAAIEVGFIKDIITWIATGNMCFSDPVVLYLVMICLFKELSENLKNLRDNWDDLKTKLSNEKKDLIYRRDEVLTPRINDLTHKVFFFSLSI